MRRDGWWPGDEAVSPVVGVVLLVGIAVALMASIGLFVLGAGPGTEMPRGEVQFAQLEGNVTITVVDGTGLYEDDLSVIVGSEEACWAPQQPDHWRGSLEAGDEIEVYGYGASCDSLGSRTDAVVRVVWIAEGGSRSEVVGQYAFA